MSEEKIQYSQWLKRGPNTFIPTDNSKTVVKLEAGVYNLRALEIIGPYLFKKVLKLDELITFETEEIKDTLNGIEKFWQREDKFREYGFVFKRGILLYGPPGTGKTSLINIISKKLIEDFDGVIITLNTKYELELYESMLPEIIRIIEPNRKLITVIEDIDGLCNGGSSETLLINILDGIEQSDNILYLATTNYPERLPKRIMNRPNRFDLRIKVGFPPPEVRREYFKSKLKPHDLATIDLEMWVDKTSGMSIAHLGELIKSVIILDNGFIETINRLEELKTTPNSVSLEKDNEDDTVGFKTVATRKKRQIGFSQEFEIGDEPILNNSEIDYINDDFGGKES